MKPCAKEVMAVSDLNRCVHCMTPLDEASDATCGCEGEQIATLTAAVAERDAALEWRETAKEPIPQQWDKLLWVCMRGGKPAVKHAFWCHGYDYWMPITVPPTPLEAVQAGMAETEGDS